MNKKLIIFSLTLVFVLGCQKKDKKIELKTDNDKVNYSIGLQIANSLKRQKVDTNVDILAKGIKDALAGKPLLTEGEMRTVMGNFYKNLNKNKLKADKEAGTKNAKAATDFLEQNKKKEGIVKLASGLQYKILTKGKGKSPKDSDKVTVHYKGTLLDGTEFDSSYKRKKPATFGVTGVIPGWTEALKLMKEGGKWQVFVPPNLAYGERGSGHKIKPNSLLVFDIELIKVN